MASFECECGYTRELKDELLGKKAKCPKCGSVYLIERDEPDSGEEDEFDIQGVLGEVAINSPRHSPDDSISSYGEEDTYGDRPGKNTVARTPASVMPLPQGPPENPSPKGIASNASATIVVQSVTVLLLIYVATLLFSTERHLQSGRTDVAEIKEFLMAPTRDDRVEWEYKISSPSDTLLDIELDGLGRDGWEVVTARRATDSLDRPSYEMILKRRKIKN